MTFPGLSRFWPLVVAVDLVVTLLLAFFVSPVFALSGPIAAIVVFVWLWGPGGRMRRQDPSASG